MKLNHFLPAAARNPVLSRARTQAGSYAKFCTLALLIAALAGCSRQNAKEVEAASKAPPPPVVKLARVEARTIERTISITGSLLPDETVNLSFEVPGTLVRVYTDFGRPVRKGEVVAELDRREIELQLERSRAALAQALARIGLGPNQVEVTPETTPAIRQAQAQTDDARSKYESASKLVTSGDISRERFTELEKAYRAREAALQAARDELRTQLAAIQGLRAEVRLSEKRLADTTLRAPFDGAVMERLVSPGQYIKENTPVVAIVKAHPLRLRAEIPESGVGSIQAGSSLTFTTDAAPGATFRAVVRELNPALNSQSRSLTAEARLVSADPRLKPGMFVQVDLVVARAARVVAVPKDALYTVAGLTKIFVVRDGAAAEYRIVPEADLGDWVAIPDVVKAGEQVAISNLGALTNGTKVQTGG
jgi:RND family efflux transporter MFP subunit